MEEELITRLIEFVESASPTIWAAAQRQLGVLMFQNILWLVMLSIAMIVCIVTAIYAKGKKDGYGDWGFVLAMAILFGLMAFFAAFGLATEIIGMTMNPDYYVIKILTGLF
jgi:hypothetical protein